jgi:cobalt/nickel transport system permease protein
LNAGTALATAGISAGAIGFALRQARVELSDKQVPLAGVAAAFVFGAQMFNFPVAAGTTGHLLGGAVAAILLGPSAGALVVAVVVAVQALAFADGGLTALGYNTLNMAVVTAFGGYGLFLGLRRLLPATATGLIAATGLASGMSVVLSAAAFAIEWLFGATAPVPFDTVFASMVSVHILIGAGEGLISALVVAAVLAARADLVKGAGDLLPAQLAERTRVPLRVFALGGAMVAVLLAAVVSQFAFDAPDGLDRVASDAAFASRAGDHALGGGVFADYATAGIGNETASLAVAGAAGVVLTLAVGSGMAWAVLAARPGEPEDPHRQQRLTGTAG